MNHFEEKDKWWEIARRKIISIWRIIRRPYFMVVVWDEDRPILINYRYRQRHKANEYINDLVEAYWKQKYKEIEHDN